MFEQEALEAPMVPVQQQGYGPSGMVVRDYPEPGEARAAYVQKICDEIKQDKARWDWNFKQIEEDIKFANGYQWPGQTRNDERMIVNICKRHVKNRVAALYARNPKAVFKRRPTLDFVIWDEKFESLQMATMDVEIATQKGGMPNPVSLAMLQEVTTVKARRNLIDIVGKTLEKLFQHTMDIQIPGFKLQMKRVVRRGIVAGVAWVKLDFVRKYDMSPDQVKNMAGYKQRLAHLERLMADIADGESNPHESDAEELRLMIEKSEKGERNYLCEESVVYTFPRATAVILDRATTSITTFENCNRVTEEFVMTPDQVQSIYNIDVGSNYTPANREGKTGIGLSSLSFENMSAQKEKLCVVWVTQDKRTGLEYTVMEGFPDFLEEPHEPNAYTDHFFTFFPLVLNEVEEDDDVYPKSEIRDARPIQKEINRSTEALRQHRIAKRPLYATYKGAFDDEDQINLANHDDHDVLILNALDEQRKIADIMQEVPKSNIDPNVYEVGTMVQHFQRVVGSPDFELGNMSGASATEVGSASAVTELNTSASSDDIDGFLSWLAEATGKCMLMEYSVQTVKHIVGAGAMWPEQSLQDIKDEIFLQTEAGSAGRPNMAQEVAKWERATPLLVQIPGVRPDWVAKKIIHILDENIDISEAYLDGLPSIMAQNKLGQMPMTGAGDPAQDPNMQGGQGGDNQAQPPGPDQGPQAGDDMPMDMY